MMDAQFSLWPILWLSLRVSGAAICISSLFGLPLGVWLGLTRFRGRAVLAGVIHTGMAIPPVVIGLVLYLMFSRSGPLGSWGWLFSPPAMIVAQFLLCLPFVVGITMSAVAAVPAELYAQLRSLGASPGQARWAIIREARAGIWLAVATALGRSLSEVGAVWIVGGNIAGHTRVLTTAIVLETGQGHFAFALVLGALLLGIALSLNLMIVRSQWRAQL